MLVGGTEGDTFIGFGSSVFGAHPGVVRHQRDADRFQRQLEDAPRWQQPAAETGDDYLYPATICNIRARPNDLCRATTPPLCVGPIHGVGLLGLQSAVTAKVVCDRSGQEHCCRRCCAPGVRPTPKSPALKARFTPVVNPLCHIDRYRNDPVANGLPLGSHPTPTRSQSSRIVTCV